MFEEKKFSRDEVTEMIKESRQNFFNKKMQNAQASMIQELCYKFAIDPRETLSHNTDKNTVWETSSPSVDCHGELMKLKATLDDWVLNES